MVTLEYFAIEIMLMRVCFRGFVIRNIRAMCLGGRVLFDLLFCRGTVDKIIFY